MLKSIIKFFSKSINTKIIMITTMSLIIFLTAVMAVIYHGMNQLKESTLEVVDEDLSLLVDEYYENYINAVDLRIEREVQNIFDELHILSGMLQDYFSNRSSMDRLVADMETSEYFKDRLVPSPKYYQNTILEPTSLFVASYMIDQYGNIDEAAMDLIDDTRILDLILPAFSKYGIKKAQVYFQGGQDKEIFRLAPWSNIGKDVVDVYPEIFDQPIWETFNPGLAGQWTEWIRSLEREEDIVNLLRVTPPVQDGLTGDVVLTFSQPIANEDFTEFMGTISFDVPITNIINMIEDIKIYESGFAFIAQDNGNVFAINEIGLRTFDLLPDQETLEGNELGFNRLVRNFSDSKLPGVQNLQINSGKDPEIQLATIESVDYFIATKGLLKYQTWSEDAGFYDVQWNLGFVAPYDEIFAMYKQIDNNIDSEVSRINFNTVVITMIIALIILFFIYRFTTLVTAELVSLSSVVKNAKDRKYDVTIDVKSSDEVGVLAGAFKDMLKEIRDSFAKLETQNETLKEEIKQRKQKDRIIDYLENFDASTDLPNKKALLNILKDISHDADGFVSLVVIGLDEFRKVNEAYSWTFGDKLINVIAKELRDRLPADSILFKLSGDEFAFILKETKFKNLISIVEQINELFKKPFYVERNEVLISSSIGISTYPYDSDNSVDIFKFASNAMIHAKEVNKGKYEFYNEEINTSARIRMEMLNEMRYAVEDDEFELIYQPIVDTKTLKVKGMEALLRWHNKHLGSIQPSVFIPLAEQSRQIIPIGEWVLKHAFEETKRLHDAGYPDLNVAVNVSIIQFLEDGFVGRLKDLFEETGIDPTRVTIEITEGLFINDLDKILSVLNAIRDTGALISVDDFGTGYSSLSYIKNLPLSKLKIDRSFIHEIHEEKSYKLVSGIIGLAKNLNMSIVAEGIETDLQLDVIREKMCEEAQGYLFSKPIPYEAFYQYIKNNLE